MSKKTILITIAAIFIMLSLSLLLISNSSKNIVERKIRVDLPESAEIVKFQKYDFIYFYTKIKIDEMDIDYIREQLLNFFKNEFSKDDRYIPNMNNVVSWWDLERNNIIYLYDIFVSGKGLFEPKSREVFAFITKNPNGNYYLYISY